MHPAVAATLAALLLGGCATTTAAPRPPPVGQAARANLAQHPAHGAHIPGQAPRPPADPTDPQAVALQIIVRGLQAQGLTVIDLAGLIAHHDPRRAVIQVAATHATAGGRQHTSVYELGLIAGPDGGWQLAGFEQVQ